MDKEEKVPSTNEKLKTDTAGKAIPVDVLTGDNATADVVEAPKESFGQWLKEQRTSKNINLEEIAAVTKVHIQQLRALEGDERKNLPAPAFVRGFLVSYARHLGIDENDVLTHYKAAYGSLTPMADLFVSTAQRAKAAQPNKTKMVTQPTIRQSPGLKEIEKPATNFLSFRNVILSFTVLAVVVLIATLISMGKKDRAATDASQVSVPAAAAPTTPETAVPTKAPEVAAKVETPAQPSAAVAAKAIPIVAVATAPEKTSTGVKKFHAELHATESTWVNVRIDNGNSKGTLIKTGASLPIEADEKVTLVISNAANVEIRWNGNWYSAPGTRGEVKSITLPDQLESLKPKSAGKKPSSTASATPKVKKTPEPASVTATPATPAAAADVAPPND